MKKVHNITINMLLLRQIKLCFIVMALFFVALINNVNAASFKYSEFDWDKFYEENKNYWNGSCDDSELCGTDILLNQKSFYKKLYKMLAKYENQGLFIDDQLIIATIFFELNPQVFSDSSSYNSEWNNDGYYESGAYNIEEEDVEDPDIDFDSEDSKDYFSSEKDTLKMLISNMIAYNSFCYGIYGDPQITSLSDGSSRLSCLKGKNVSIDGVDKCVHVESNTLGFWEYSAGKWPVLGIFVDDENKKDCLNHSDAYPEGTKYLFGDGKVVSTDKYFDFLRDNRYFDGKKHLQSYFSEILKNADVKCMTNSVCDDSLERSGKYDEYQEQIEEVRTNIIRTIIGVVNDYNGAGKEIIWNQNSSSLFEESGLSLKRKNYFFPIGSLETTVVGDITYAAGNPETVAISSFYGNRVNTINGAMEFNYGIDIATNSFTRVIAVSEGEVISVVNSCIVGDYSCNDGYGNSVTILHSNGDYSIYANMSQIEANVAVNSSVQKGQVLGFAGMTGNTNSNILHFEIREGNNDIINAIDPLSILDTSDPRPKSQEGDFDLHFTSLSKTEFATKMINYCNSNKCRKELVHFVNNADYIYDISVGNGINPEFVVVRAIAEGFSPGSFKNNYWGIGCYNKQHDKCLAYSSLGDGIKGLANLNIVKKSDTALELMLNGYASLGAWYNPGSWADGGCKYFDYIKEYMSPERVAEVSLYCAPDNLCDKKCPKIQEDEKVAYATWQVASNMAKMRYNIFDL